MAKCLIFCYPANEHGSRRSRARLSTGAKAVRNDDEHGSRWPREPFALKHTLVHKIQVQLVCGLRFYFYRQVCNFEITIIYRLSIFSIVRFVASAICSVLITFMAFSLRAVSISFCFNVALASSASALASSASALACSNLYS